MSFIATDLPVINYGKNKSGNTELQQDSTEVEVEDKSELIPNEKAPSLSEKNIDISEDLKIEKVPEKSKRKNARKVTVATEEAADGATEAPKKRALRVKKSEQKELPIEEPSTAEIEKPKSKNARTVKVVAEEELPKTRGGRHRKKEVSDVETTEQQPEKKQSRSTKRKDSVEKVEEPISAEKKEKEEVVDNLVPTNRRGRKRKITVTITEMPAQGDSSAESQTTPGKTRAVRTRGQMKVSYNEQDDNDEQTPIKEKKPAAKRTTKRTVGNNENDESAITEPAKKQTRNTRKRQPSEAVETDAAKKAETEEIVDEPVVVSDVGKGKRERKPVAAVQQFMDNVRARAATPKRVQQLASTSTPQPHKKLDPLPSDISAVILDESRTTRSRGKTPLALENTNIEGKQPASEKRGRGRPKNISKALAETQAVVETTVEELKTTKTRRGAGKATQKAEAVESSEVAEKEKEIEAKPKRGAKRQASEAPENANVSTSSTRGRRNVRFDETAAKVETADSPLPAKRVMRPRRK